MVEHGLQLDKIFHALAHEVRRSILRRLAANEFTVSELAEPLAMSLWAASKHIQVLEAAGLVQCKVHGRSRLCRLESAPLASAASWIQFYEQHWEQRLDALQDLLEKTPRSKRKKR
jgi:DNA-binding transcriptional ArsR family regulator